MRLKNKIAFIVCFAVMVTVVSLAALPANNLERGFAAPPASARPWVYWFWMNGNITREGITADLEAMQRVGIGGVLILDAYGTHGERVPQGPANFATPTFQALLKHAITEADRLGLVVDMSIGDGWSSGGPWIKPEHSMQTLVTSEKLVTGPAHFDEVLPHPPGTAAKTVGSRSTRKAGPASPLTPPRLPASGERICRNRPPEWQAERKQPPKVQYLGAHQVQL